MPEDTPKPPTMNVGVAIVCMLVSLLTFAWLSDGLVHRFGFFALPLGALFAVWLALVVARTISNAWKTKAPDRD